MVKTNYSKKVTLWAVDSVSVPMKLVSAPAVDRGEYYEILKPISKLNFLSYIHKTNLFSYHPNGKATPVKGKDYGLTPREAILGYINERKRLMKVLFKQKEDNVDNCRKALVLIRDYPSEKSNRIDTPLLTALYQIYDNLSWNPADSKEALIGYIKDAQDAILETIEENK